MSRRTLHELVVVTGMLQQIIGRQLLVPVAGEERLDDAGPVESHRLDLCV